MPNVKALAKQVVITAVMFAVIVFIVNKVNNPQVSQYFKVA